MYIKTITMEQFVSEKGDTRITIITTDNVMHKFDIGDGELTDLVIEAKRALRERIISIVDYANTLGEKAGIK